MVGGGGGVLASRLHNNIDKHKYGVDRLSPIGPLRRLHEPAKRHLHRPRAVVRVSVLRRSKLDPHKQAGRNCG